MRKILMASLATISLVLSLPALAQSPDNSGDADAGAVVGAGGGGATGAVVGGILGGPLGAVVGGFAGAVIGAEAGVQATSVDYAAAHAVDPVYIQGDLNAGYVLPSDVVVHPIEGDPDYGYIYANGRVWIVDLAQSSLVYSPGYVVSQSSADFAIANPVAPVNAQGDVVVGYVLPDDVAVTPVPDDPTYGYVYLGDRPALVDTSSRTIVWLR